MMRGTWLAGCSLTTLLLMTGGLMTGCNQQTGAPASAQSGGVAVIDLDDVASQLGRDAEITQKLKLKQEELNGKLAQVKNVIVNQIKLKQVEFGEELNDQQRQHLQAMQVQGNVTLKQAQNQAVQLLQAHRAELIKSFRDQVTPFAKQVAAQKGMTTIVPKNDMIISVEPSAEISSSVAQLMKAKGYTAQPLTTPNAPAGDEPAFGAGEIQQVGHEQPAGN